MVGDNAQKQVTADVLETDRSNDLALLKLSSTSMASSETKSLISKLAIPVFSKSGTVPFLCLLTVYCVPKTWNWVRD